MAIVRDVVRSLLVGAVLVTVGAVIGCSGLSEDLDGLTYPGPPAPEQLEVSSGEHWDAVVVSWDPVDNADGYRVYRDEEIIYEGPETEYRDQDAAAPQLEPPANLEATDDHPGYVELTWEAATGEDGDSHNYRVTATLEDDEGESTDVEPGYRGTPEVQTYEVWAEDEMRGTADADGATVSYRDEDAPGATLELNEDGVSASRGAYDGEVRLFAPGDDTGGEFFEELVVQPAPAETYTVRAVVEESENDPFGDADSAQGRRDIDDVDRDQIQVRWERFADADAASSSTEVAAEEHDGYWADTDLPADNTPRYYQMIIDEPEQLDPWSSKLVVGYARCRPDADADFGGGLGEDEMPFQLCSDDQLRRLAEVVEQGGPEASAYFELVEDIELDSEPFVPVGTESAPFAGEFDGGYFSIENLVVHAEKEGGLFGHLDQARVHRLHIGDVLVEVEDGAGAAAAKAVESEFEEVIATGRVDGGDGVGGMVGEAVDSSFEQVHASVDVTAGADIDAAAVGGLVGRALDLHVVEGSARGLVFGYDAYAGGLAGAVDDGLYEDVYATGSVYTGVDSKAGGLFGEADGDWVIERGYARGGVRARDGNDWSEHYDFVVGDPVSDGTVEFLRYNEDAWCGPALAMGDGCDGEPGAAVPVEDFDQESQFTDSGDGFEFGAPGDDDAVWTIVATGPRHQWKTGSPWEWLSDCDGTVDGSPQQLDDIFNDGSGSEASPWSICSADQLQALNDVLDADNASLDDYFRLDADIELGDREWSAIGYTDDDETEPLDIDLDGAGHRISNLNLAEEESSENGYRGLFASLDSSANVRNLELVDMHLDLHGDDEAAGGVAGVNRGTLEQLVITGKLDTSGASGFVTEQEIGPAGGVVGDAGFMSAISDIRLALDVTLLRDHDIKDLGGVAARLNSNGELANIDARVHMFIRSYPQDTYPPYDQIRNVGGIVGSASFSSGDQAVQIRDCRVRGSIDFVDDSRDPQARRIGGVVGHARKWTSGGDPDTSVSLQQIERCSVGDGAGMELRANGQVGGIVGAMEGLVELDAVASGAEIYGEEAVGGVVGKLETGDGLQPPVLTNSYFFGSLVDPPSSSGALAGRTECTSLASGEPTELNDCSGDIGSFYGHSDFESAGIDADPLVGEMDEPPEDDEGLDDWREQAHNHWIDDDLDVGTDDHLWGEQLAEGAMDDSDCYGDAEDCDGSEAWDFDDVWTMPAGGPPRLQWQQGPRKMSPVQGPGL